jgi:voltage-gated potassium channel
LLQEKASEFDKNNTLGQEVSVQAVLRLCILQNGCFANLSDMNAAPPNRVQWRDILHTVIFEAETPAGKWFDILLIISILASVIAIMLDSVSSINILHGKFLNAVEWFFTILFSIEYILRLLCVRRPLLYATSFFGIVDLVAIIPTYISLFIPGTQYLLVVRILRILRIFRVLKLVQYMGEAVLLLKALRASSRKISVFLFTVITLVIILGSLMYLIEGAQNGFTSIPRSIYWAIVTLTTVGYGDISPQTNIGQMLAAFIMILGYSIIAVPTGIVTVELSQVSSKKATRSCRHCSAEGHDSDAVFCKYCGEKL